MIRYIKDILDIKNVLGMQRPQPLPAYPAGQTVFRNNNGLSVSIVPIYTGTITFQYSVGGVTQTITHPVSHSGLSIVLLTPDQGTDIVITGDLQQLTFNSNNVDFIAVGNTLGDLNIRNNIKILDLRNADALTSYGVVPYSSVDTLYAIATTSATSAISSGVISSSTVTDGVLWIKSSETYAQDVIAVAKAHGWKVYYL